MTLLTCLFRDTITNVVCNTYTCLCDCCHFRDAITTAIVCAATSLLAGMVVFSVIGYLAHEMNEPIDNVMKSGEKINPLTRS